MKSSVSTTESKLRKVELSKKKKKQPSKLRTMGFSCIKLVEMSFVTSWPQGQAAKSVISALLERHSSLCHDVFNKDRTL